MANLKRNMLELVKNPEGVLKGDEPEIEKVWTPAFIPLRVARNAIEVWNQVETDAEMSETDKFDKIADFVANEVFAGKITPNDIYNRLHAPGGQDVLKQQLIFVAQGQQSDETKNFLAKRD
ncbi:phage tail assembly chaperone G [Radiobacillus sp. PE A8.2]|uniref:phage tail assembly chaperone G n=1 Tax=Radiobacillus sp. PE A8.2 TaxID=3380349 RepID=UPI00388E2614